MAEAYAKKYWKNIDVYSAGLEKHGLNPYMLKVMSEDGFTMKEHYSKTLDDVNGISFDVEDRDSAINQARELAIQDAKEKAQAIADAAGVQLGDLLSINVYSAGTPVTYYDAKGGAYSESSIPVSAGTLTIMMECSLTYALK